MADETARVVMNWPKELKEQVRAATGGERGGLTDFVLKAVNLHLGNDSDIQGLEVQLGEARHFTQQLADQLVLGGGPEERLQFLMELQFPDWIQTQGWPEAYAERVRPHQEARAEINAADPERPAEGTITVTEVVPARPIDRSGETDEIGGEECSNEVLPGDEGLPYALGVEDPAKLDLPHDAQGDDLFSRLKAAGKLKVASDLPQPEPMVMRDICGTCGEEKIDGECWTCG